MTPGALRFSVPQFIAAAMVAAAPVFSGDAALAAPPGEVTGDLMSAASVLSWSPVGGAGDRRPGEHRGGAHQVARDLTRRGGQRRVTTEHRGGGDHGGGDELRNGETQGSWRHAPLLCPGGVPGHERSCASIPM